MPAVPPAAPAMPTLEKLHIDTVNPYRHADAAWAFSPLNTQGSPHRKFTTDFVSKVTELEGKTPSDEEFFLHAKYLYAGVNLGGYWKGKLVLAQKILTQ